jgi:hypothetical protein
MTSYTEVGDQSDLSFRFADYPPSDESIPGFALRLKARKERDDGHTQIKFSGVPVVIGYKVPIAFFPHYPSTCLPRSANSPPHLASCAAA